MCNFRFQTHRKLLGLPLFRDVNPRHQETLCSLRKASFSHRRRRHSPNPYKHCCLWCLLSAISAIWAKTHQKYWGFHYFATWFRDIQKPYIPWGKLAFFAATKCTRQPLINTGVYGTIWVPFGGNDKNHTQNHYVFTVSWRHPANPLKTFFNQEINPHEPDSIRNDQLSLLGQQNLIECKDFFDCKKQWILFVSMYRRFENL